VTEERIGEAFELDMQLTVVGRRLQPGDAAPDFALDYLDSTDSAIHTMRLADCAGQVRLLHVINSLDTPVCHVSTCHAPDAMPLHSEAL
jgi:thioredoxin-dependent peroxiredoxin